MLTQCNKQTYDFQALAKRMVTATFDGGAITSDAGALLLREVEAKTGILQRFAACFTDHRDLERIQHTVLELISQRVYGLALGYEDLNDHDSLRHDPLFGLLVNKADLTGQDRPRLADQGKALAGKSTLNRLERTPVGANSKSRYKKIVANHRDIESTFVETFLVLHPKPPTELVLDLDATDDPIHGHQSGRFFHGYYDCDCYLPLYIFCGEHLLCAKLRPSDIDGAAGAQKQLARIVARIRQQPGWANVRIIARGDSGFCRELLMQWCEANNVDYLFGLAKNKRLLRILGGEMHEAKLEFAATGQAARVFKDFTYKTKKSWIRERRVVGKAEHLAKGANPRFIVTSISAEEIDARRLYEYVYCARGEMENRIKEQQLCLFADRTSCATMRANQLRLWMSSVAYTLLQALRQIGLRNTEMANSRCDTIRLRLLKLGALIRTSVRRVWISLSESSPVQRLFAQVYKNVRRWSPRSLDIDAGYSPALDTDRLVLDTG
jgi:hypothetical protein